MNVASVIPVPPPPPPPPLLPSAKAATKQNPTITISTDLTSQSASEYLCPISVYQDHHLDTKTSLMQELIQYTKSPSKDHNKTPSPKRKVKLDISGHATSHKKQSPQRSPYRRHHFSEDGIGPAPVVLRDH